MLNLKVSKQTRTEVSQNKVINIKHINKLSKSKVNNQSNKFSNITKKCITKKTRNPKLKTKILHKRKNSFSYRKKCLLHHSLKINKRGGDPNNIIHISIGQRCI